MKTLSLILSGSVLCIATYFFVINFNLSTEINHLLYMSILFILMAICVVGILMNMPLLLYGKRKVISYSNYSKKQIVNKGKSLINTNFSTEKTVEMI
ncbi:hypothetical protein GV828_02805 [Flavobacterium sp. NST-5]|uniref:Lipoprotein n=1 Tax=Flavobacterium ichthyis TaxID=2698827 RepID=A0ABW9Z5Z6_9FLAO|nr:hypothetical protein [Flavobacterium ichthyis]NBL64126.1 hypothetical protein [Flavobacterium ichthyis]